MSATSATLSSRASRSRFRLKFFNISGQETIDYIDLIKSVKAATKSQTPVVRIPYQLFWLLLKTYAIADKNPPFTTSQLEALVIPEVFEVIDWPKIFGVRATPLAEALRADVSGSDLFSTLSLEF